MTKWWDILKDFQDANENVGQAKCEDCEFYSCVDSGYGFCRRYPPEEINVGRWWNPKRKMSYPVVEWCRRACGEFKFTPRAKTREVK